MSPLRVTTTASANDAARAQLKVKHKRDAAPPHKKQRNKHVRFSSEPPEWLEQLETYYPTPQDARPVLPTTSIRRFTIDEVELYFSEDLTLEPVSERDYAVHAIKGRDEFLACGSVEYRKLHMGITIWRACWAELYHGVLMLRKYKDKSVEKKRTLVPIADCALAFVDFKDHVLAVSYQFQGQPKRRVLRFACASELFLWWWALHIAAMSPVDGHVLHKSMSRPALSPLFFLATAESAAESVFFPHAMLKERPESSRTGRSGSGSSRPRLAPSHRSDETGKSGAGGAPAAPDRSAGVVHLIFVRHGEAENMHFRVCDREKKLTPRGLEQAEATAQFLQSQLAADRSASDKSVTLIYGGLRRTVETASALTTAMPWLTHKFECSLLDEGAPRAVGPELRQEYRDAMHKIAFESICRWTDAGKAKQPRANSHGTHTRRRRDAYKIIVCHASFIQYCVAQCYGVAKEVIQLGAPIAHCSLTQIDVMKGDAMEAEYTNRVTHLPLTHRTSD